MHQMRDVWQRLTHPQSIDKEDARREGVARTILVMMGTVCVFFTLPVIVGWASGAFTLEPVIIMLTLDLLAWGGWWLAGRGHWQFSSHIPALLLLALASYLTLVNGLVTTGILFYALAILLTAMVCSGWSPWIVWGLSVVLYVGFGWLHGDRAWDLWAPVVITVIGALLGVTLLQWLFTRSSQQASVEASDNAAELLEYRERLEKLVEGRTGALRAMYQDLQKEVAQRRRAEDVLLVVNRELEGRIHERADTLSRANEQLQEEIAVRRQAEEEARSSAEKLRAVFEAITDGIVVADKEGHITDVNVAWLRLHGFESRDEVIGRSALEMISEEQRTLATTRHHEAIASGTNGILHYTLLTRDGAEFDGEVHAALLKDADGNPSGLVVRVRDITESLRHEEALRRSEEQFRRIFENSPMGIYRATPEGRFLVANPAMVSMLGFDSFADLARHNVADLLVNPAVSHQEFRQIMEREGEVVGLESEWIRRDGSTLHVRENARAIAEGGEVRYFEGTFEDITERMVATDQLAASEVRYRSIVDLAPDGIVTISLSGIVTSCNNMFLELTGFTREQIVGKHFTKVPTLRARDLPRWIQVFASIVGGKTPDPIEFAWTNAAGIQRWGEARVSLIRKNGRIDSVLVLARDITEQRRTEQMLWALNHASLEMERALTHEDVFRSVSTELKEVGFSAHIFLADESRTHVSTSYIGLGSGVLRAAEKLVGLKHEQFTFSIEDIPLYQRVIWDRETIFVEKSTDIARQVLPSPFNKAAGELVKLFNTPRLVIAPLISGDDVFGAFIVQSEHLTQDDVPTITAFAYQVAATWRKTNLIHSLEESFADLKETQDQLLQAQRMEAVGRLAGGVAHDFNNLLTAISGYAELLLATLTDGGPPDHQSRQMVLADLQEIRRAAERARGVTQQLLAFSRKQVLEPRVIDLNALVENIEKMLHRLIGENIRFRTIFSPSLWRVQADPGQLEQVILNLAINARDAMPTGGRLTIETYNVTLDEALAEEYAAGRSGEYVVLIVSDTGTGIDEELLPHIFEPFFTTKEEGQGTGLGLATVYGIVTQSNGFIEAESKLGRGTTFKIFLPRTELSDETSADEGQPMALPAGDETILVAEDEQLVRDLASKVLQACGYTVLVAAHPHNALKLSAHHEGPIHLLLSDIVMPDMTGPQLAKKILAGRPETRLLLMSGYADGVLDQLGHLDAAGEFLQKPFTPYLLAKRVRQILDLARVSN